jgi:chloramphenicol 3-O-phosphotransferase
MLTDSVFLNGTVGAGKSSTADALQKFGKETGSSQALIDLDQIRLKWPAPPGDPFNHELELVNLAALVSNYRNAGATRFVVAGVIEDAREIVRYEAALQSTGLFICRLVVSEATLAARLAKRHAGDQGEREWHLRRAGELSGILDAAAVDHLVIDTTNETPRDTALKVRDAIGW